MTVSPAEAFTVEEPGIITSVVDDRHSIQSLFNVNTMIGNSNDHLRLNDIVGIAA